MAAKVAFRPSRSLRPALDQTAGRRQRAAQQQHINAAPAAPKPHQEAAARIGGAQAELAVEGGGQCEGAAALDGRACIA